MSNLRISGITKDSIVDGPGLRYVVFVQGCYHKCEGCHNPQTHDPQDGTTMDINKILEDFINNPMYSGITFSGGEPFLQADALADLATKIKIKNAMLGKKYDIICYTGYTYEQIKETIDNGVLSYFRLLYTIDYLIDGKFEKDKASLDCKWRGSTNQRIIDVQESIAQKKVIEIEL